MGFKKWVVKDTDRQLAKQLAKECDVDPIIALIASARGYDDPADLEQFLSDEPCFSDVYALADIMHAADLVNMAIEQNKKIAIFGDYDCDGVTATALLFKYLQSRGSDCIYYIPDRFSEGYGMNCAAVEQLKADGIEFIITVDNGIACFEEIKLANSLGITVVVTDHHLPGDKLPEAAAVVDPHRIDCPSEFKSVCGAQVAFMLICVMEGKEPEELLPYFADILSVAIIADVMPLTFENRSIVKYGVLKMRMSALTGFSALLNVSGVKINDVTAEKIAFSICPRINAAGRMGSAKTAVELLCETDMLKALKIANEIDELNSLRQQTEKNICNEVIDQIELNGYSNDRVIVVCGENWHHGVVGIVASRICERYGSPCIVLSVEGELAHGSGRSYDGFSLFEAVNNCKSLLEKFGGHALACGLTIRVENVNLFREAINKYAYTKEYCPPVLSLDCKLNPQAISIDLAETLKQLEPFGFQNQVPLFGIFGVTLQRITPLSNNKHLKLLFSKDKACFQALLFGVGTDSFSFESGDTLDLAVTLDINNYNDNVSVSVQVKALRLSNTDDDKMFFDIDNYRRFCSQMSYNACAITPSRNEVGEVYRFITPNGVLYNKVINNFIKTLNYGKTAIALDVLENLELIKFKDNKFFKLPNAEKTNLSNSAIYNKLLKECGNNDRNTNKKL